MNPLPSIKSFFESVTGIGGSRHTPRRAVDEHTKNYVVFDFDETLGYFAQFNGLIQAIEKTFKRILTESQLFELLDAFPEIFRPQIFAILEYIKHKLITGICDGVILYTNNQGPKAWSQFIIRYMNHRMKFQVFNKIVAAWKIGDTIIEPCRTSHNKSYKDLRRCAALPEKIRICFIDDRPHEEMFHDDITYILVAPYYRKYYHDDMVSQFMKTSLAKTLLADAEIQDEGRLASDMLGIMLSLKLDIDKTHISSKDVDTGEQIMSGLNLFLASDPEDYIIPLKPEKSQRGRGPHQRARFTADEKSQEKATHASALAPAPTPTSIYAITPRNHDQRHRVNSRLAFPLIF